jgi:hypothetical protein
MSKKGKWDPARRAAAQALIHQCGWPPKAVAAVLGIAPGNARKLGERPEPPRVTNSKIRLRGTVLRLREAMWPRAMIAAHLRIPLSLVDRTIDSTPDKPVYHPRRKPSAATAALPEATSPAVEGPEVSTEPAAGAAVHPLADDMGAA